ncbi:hypothetical protein KY339_00640 [Candidatus Woesearchaeota archaeon]|nr:hypothetical protein [Candidatus Woesearchaeota archaeon]
MKSLKLFLMILLVFFILLPFSFAFSNLLWLEEGSTVRTLAFDAKGDLVVHNVTLVDVATTQDICGFEVDGETVWINVKSKKEVNGVRVYARDVIRVHSQLKDMDFCRVIVSGSILKVVPKSEEAPLEEEIIEVVANASNETLIEVITEEVEEVIEEEIPEVIEEVQEEIPPEEKPGIFRRIWNWLGSLF